MDVPSFDAMQTRRREILARIAAMTDEERERVPAKGWSPLGVLDHLNVTDRITLERSGVRPGRGTRHPALPLMIWGMRQGWTLPSPAVSHPQGGRGYEELAAESEANHAGFAALVAQATEADVVAQHPLLGPLTATQASKLLDSHYRYHLARLPSGSEKGNRT